MDKHKLFLLSPMLHQGGFERVCVTTARVMADVFDISIVIFDDADIAYDISGLNIINLNLGVKNGAVAKILNVFKRVKAYRKLLKQEKPGISYSFGITANLVNSLAKVKDTKVFLGLRSYMDVWEKKKMYLFTKRGDLVVACSKVIENEIKKDYPWAKTCTLYNLYDIDEIKRLAQEDVADMPWNDDRKILISLGREDEVKCFWHMIKAFYLVHKEIPNTALMILGDGDFGKYDGLVKALGLEDSISLAGLKKNPYKYLNKSDVYMLTSRNEGFPNALVEGMCLGLAAVATDCMTGPREILKDGEYGILIPTMNPEPDFNADNCDDERLMADKIIEILKDENKLKEYQRLAAKRALDFSYQAYHEEFEKMCTQ